MDLSIWPNIKFTPEYTSAYSSFHQKEKEVSIDFIFIISDYSYYVIVKHKEEELFAFCDETMNNNKDLNTFKRTIYYNNTVKIYYINNWNIDLHLKEMNTKFITSINKDIINLNSCVATKIIKLKLWWPYFNKLL
uniref:DNA polymerase n=1 Tax=Cladobotryum mycophilum TaxID=491253 RepID=A0A7S8J2Z4_9HYPO|nr:DNA polymerase [Cladobotryum mycophilum]QPD06695.1 DNA polymerase [Cladobotryum mycophilum]